ncbi:hypothetical protein WMF01_18725 [Sorangium sp. So ce1667]
MAEPFICSIELSKTDGVTVIVKDEDANITQTVAMNGKTVTITVKKGDDKTSTITQDAESLVLEVVGEQTSTITQKHDQVVVKCKAFSVDAETVSIKSEKDSTHEAGGKLTVTSTKDMALSSSAKLSASSTSEMKLESSAALKASATGDAKISGANTTVEASAKLALKGGVAADMSAGKISISGTMKADLTAPLTTVGEDVTTVKGTLVKVSGSLVKLG